ncbi:MAG: AI-2E family transporter [Candidatus Taylorbacteria bacterium]|nr:AI-2E family transporter [Candidatus Taylorbacteria bacterium]
MEGPNKEIHITIKSGSIVRAMIWLIFFALLYYIRDLVLVVLTAVVIASAMEPFTVWFGKHHLARLPAVILMYLALVGVIAGIFYFFLPPLLNDTSNFLASTPHYLDSVAIWDPLHKDSLSESKQAVQSLSENINQSRQVVSGLSSGLSLSQIVANVRVAISSLSQGFVETFSLVFGGILSSVLIIVLSFYLAVQEDGVAAFLQFVIPDRNEKYIIGLWKRVQAKIGLWMQGQLILALVVGLLVYLVLAIFGPVLHVGNPVLLAFLAAAFETIPLFGPILSAIPAVLASYTDGSLGTALIVVGIYLVIHQLENHLIYPLVVRKIIGVPPILVILALIVGFELAGFLGIILSVPVATTLMEYFNDLQKRKQTTA